MRRPRIALFTALLAVTPFALTLAACSPASTTVTTRTTATTTTNGTPDTTIHVQTDSSLGAIPSTAFGLNTASWNQGLLAADIPPLLRAADIGVLRYPGGSWADTYHWMASDPNSPTTFDDFMRVAQATSAQAILTVNYGTGTRQEAADWVRYANKGGSSYTGPVPAYVGASNTGHTYGVTYWEIGNELYGAGSYGATWETDLHAEKGPAAYGQNAMDYISAMKAVDPSIKIGVTLTAPGNWPDGDLGLTPNWNNTVLQETCAGLDFADVHWYPQDPGAESDANLLGSPKNGISGRTEAIPAMVARLRAEISQNCPSRAAEIQILITEANSVSSNPGKQTTSPVNALFLDDAYMTWLEQGIANVDWWDLHNGPVAAPTSNASASLYGATNYGDYGVLSTGEPGEPAADTPLPAYYGLLMLAHLARPGDTMLSASTDSANVLAHAVKQANGDLAVMLINTSRSATQNAAFSLAGFAAAPNPAVYTYTAAASSGIVSSTVSGTAATFVQRLAPYSVTVVVFAPAKR